MLACATVPLARILPARGPAVLTRAQHLRVRGALIGITVVVAGLRVADGLALDLSPGRYKGEWPTGAILHVDSLLAGDPRS